MMKLRAMLVAREREKKCMMKMHTDGAALYKYLAHIKFFKDTLALPSIDDEKTCCDS